MKKLGLYILCAFITLGICGCEKSFKSQIVDHTFGYEVKTNEDEYGSIIAKESITFYEDGKAVDKVDLEFTGEYKEYAEEILTDEDLHTKNEGTYTMDEENKTIVFEFDDITYKLRYNEETNCLIDQENEKIKFCEK